MSRNTSTARVAASPRREGISVASAAENLATILALPPAPELAKALAQPLATHETTILAGWLREQIPPGSPVIELHEIPPLVSRLVDLFYTVDSDAVARLREESTPDCASPTVKEDHK